MKIGHQSKRLQRWSKFKEREKHLLDQVKKFLGSQNEEDAKRLIGERETKFVNLIREATIKVTGDNPVLHGKGDETYGWNSLAFLTLPLYPRQEGETRQFRGYAGLKPTSESWDKWESHVMNPTTKEEISLGTFHHPLSAVWARSYFLNIFIRDEQGILLLNDIPSEWVAKLVEFGHSELCIRAMDRTKTIQKFWKMISDMIKWYDESIGERYDREQISKSKEFMSLCWDRVSKSEGRSEGESIEASGEKACELFATALCIIAGRLNTEGFLREEQRWKFPWSLMEGVGCKPEAAYTESVEEIEACVFWSKLDDLVQGPCPGEGETRSGDFDGMCRDGFELMKNHGLFPTRAVLDLSDALSWSSGHVAEEGVPEKWEDLVDIRAPSHVDDQEVRLTPPDLCVDHATSLVVA